MVTTLEIYPQTPPMFGKDIDNVFCHHELEQSYPVFAWPSSRWVIRQGHVDCNHPDLTTKTSVSCWTAWHQGLGSLSSKTSYHQISWWHDEVRLYVNSLGPSDAIWPWRSWSTLVQVMACCLMAPSHYLNQCWLIISKVLWHSSEDIIIRRFEDSNQ